MMDSVKLKIAKAFCRKSRGAFRPLTADDISVITGLRPDVCAAARVSMMFSGLIVAFRTKGEAIYELTDEGRDLVLEGLPK